MKNFYLVFFWTKKSKIKISKHWKKWFFHLQKSNQIYSGKIYVSKKKTKIFRFLKWAVWKSGGGKISHVFFFGLKTDYCGKFFWRFFFCTKKKLKYGLLVWSWEFWKQKKFFFMVVKWPKNDGVSRVNVIFACLFFIPVWPKKRWKKKVTP